MNDPPEMVQRSTKRFDLKELTSRKKDGIRNAIHKKRDQADNFIIDISKSEVTENELNKQIENVFNSYNTQFVDTIMVIKGEDVVKILKRQ